MHFTGAQTNDEGHSFREADKPKPKIKRLLVNYTSKPLKSIWDKIILITTDIPVIATNSIL